MSQPNTDYDAHNMSEQGNITFPSGGRKHRDVFMWTSLVLQVQLRSESSVFCEAGIPFTHQNTDAESFEVKA